MKIAIQNGRLIDPANGIDAALDLFVADGRIAAVGRAPDGFAADRTIDAAGCVVCPGLVDLAARLPSLDTELEAAVAGGVTTLACPPDTAPPLDEPGLVERLVWRTGASGLARVLPVGALTRSLAGEALAPLAGLAGAGCVAFSQGARPLTDTQVLLRAMQYVATFGFAIWLRPQDPYLGRGGVAHDGEIAARLGLPGIPTCAETVAVGTAIQLARETGARLHLARLSSAAGIDLVRRARAEGIAVSCDVGIHHLHLSEVDIGFFDSNARFDPPLRAEADRKALSAAVAEGVAALCSDHTPVDEDGKQLPFGEAEVGATGLELLLPLTLAWAADAGVSLPTAIARITRDPAAILGIDAGHLAPGAAADVCVFDPTARWQVGPDTLRSQGKNTPFSGDTLTGRVRATLVGGRIVFGR